MKCPHCGFDRILPMYKVCPQCKQPLNSNQSVDSKEHQPNQTEPETKGITGLLWSYKKAISEPASFKVYAKRNPHDSERLLAKWKDEGRDISSLVDEKPSASHTHSEANNVATAETEAPMVAETVSSDVNTVRTKNKSNNYVTWTVASGQIARNISATEFAGIADVDGVYVQEGVTAVIFVDGEEVTELSGGLYKFVNERVNRAAASQYAEDLEDERAHEGIIKKIGRVGRSLLNLVFGQSEKSRREDAKKRREKIKELSKKITGNSVVSVVLKRDGAISLTMGISPATEADGSVKMEFAPYKIRTKTLTVDVALALEARIHDFRDFRISYLTDQNSYSVNDLRVALNTWMRTSLQRALQNYEADGQLIPADLQASISYELMEQSRKMLHGIAISNVLDITTDNEAFARFRDIEEKFYCTEKEIEYLGRSNEFKNRLQLEENAQTLREAESEFDLRKALDKINNDKLIHEDEMEAFVQLLQSQKHIREAKTENDELAALLELKGNRLVSEDEYDAIESSIRDKKFDRDQVSAAFQIQSAHRTESIRLQMDTQFEKSKLLADAELNDIRFESLKKETERGFAINDIEESFRRKQELAEAAHQKELIEAELAATRQQAEFEDERRNKDYEFSHREAQDAVDLEKQKSQNEMDILRQKADIARQNMEAMQKHEQEMAEKKHQEEMAKISIQKDMSAEQLMAFGAAGLSAEAQKAFAESLGAGKGGEREREMYERMLQMQAESSTNNQAQQAALMQQMMQMMQGAMQTNATMATNMAAGQAEQTKIQMQTMQSIAGARVSQAEGMKEEYRKQMEHEQKRTDATQDKALNYTTKITQEEIKASAKTGAKAPAAEDKPYFVPDFSNSYTKKEVENYILQGIIGPESDIQKDGEDMKVFECEEFYAFLLQKYGATCPQCGKKYLSGFMCECGFEE